MNKHQRLFKCKGYNLWSCSPNGPLRPCKSFSKAQFPRSENPQSCSLEFENTRITETLRCLKNPRSLSVAFQTSSSPIPKVQPRRRSSPDSLSRKMWGQCKQLRCPQCRKRDRASEIVRLWGQEVKAGISERTGSLRWNLEVRRWCFESRQWEEEGGRVRQAERSLGCELFLNVQVTWRYHLSHISGGSSNTVCPSIKRLSMV